MLMIVGIMLGGVFTGYLLKNRNPGWIARAIMVAIWLLLFLLGAAVGQNNTILDHLDTIGWQALVLSAGGVGGSVLLAGVVYRFFFQGKRHS